MKALQEPASALHNFSWTSATCMHHGGVFESPVPAYALRFFMWWFLNKYSDLGKWIAWPLQKSKVILPPDYLRLYVRTYVAKSHHKNLERYCSYPKYCSTGNWFASELFKETFWRYIKLIQNIFLVYI